MQSWKRVIVLNVEKSVRRKEYCVSNWPGSFKIKVFPRKGSHNFVGVRYDFWFEFGNNAFHGVTYGDNTQVAHIRCLKNK